MSCDIFLVYFQDLVCSGFHLWSFHSHSAMSANCCCIFRTAAFSSDLVSQHFSSHISLATVLLVFFSLTETLIFLNLHSCHKTSLLDGKNKQSTTGWIKALACALTGRLGKATKTLFKHNTLSQDQNIDSGTDPVASKLDLMAETLDLIPVYSKTLPRVKHKLMTVSHQKITAIHVICPSIMECNEPHCNHWAL